MSMGLEKSSGAGLMARAADGAESGAASSAPEMVRSRAATVAQHTSTPWEYVPSNQHHGPYITSQFGNTIADFYMMSQPSERSTANGGPSKPIHFLHEMAEQNAALAVCAVNSYAALVRALTDLLELCETSAMFETRDIESYKFEAIVEDTLSNASKALKLAGAL